MNLATILDTVADGADALGQALAPASPHAKTVASLIELVLRNGAKYAKAGKDPVSEITRVLSSDPFLQKVESGWEEHLDNAYPSWATGEGSRED